MWLVAGYSDQAFACLFFRLLERRGGVNNEEAEDRKRNGRLCRAT